MTSKKRDRVDEDLQGNNGNSHEEADARKLSVDKLRKPEDSENKGYVFELRLLVERVCDSKSNIENQLVDLGKVLAEEEKEYAEIISSAIISCALELTIKLPYYATLVACINKTSVTNSVLKSVSTQFSSCLKQGNWFHLKLLLRFLIELSKNNVINFEKQVFPLFQQIKGLVQSGNIRDSAIKESMSHLILISIPWMSSFYKEDNEDWKNLQSFLDGQLFHSEYLIQLRASTKDQKSSSITLIPRSHIKCNGSNDAMDVEKVNLLEEITIDMVPSTTEGMRNPPHLDRHSLNLLKDKNEDLQYLEEYKQSPLDYVVLDEYFMDTLTALHRHGHQEASHALATLLTEIGGFPSKDAHLCTQLVDLLFSQMFQLPQGIFKSVYYMLVLIDLCHEKVYINSGGYSLLVTTIVKYIHSIVGTTPSVEKVTTILNQQGTPLLNNLDSDCYDRFVDFCGQLLAHFDFKWNWDAWKQFLPIQNSDINMTPQYQFLLDLFEKMSRLSFPEKMRYFIDSEQFHSLIPSKLPEYSKLTINDQLVDYLREKRSIPEVKAFFSDLKVSGNKDMLLLQVILVASSKSIQHLSMILERYGDLIKEILQIESNKANRNKKEAYQKLLVDVIVDFWKSNTLMMKVTLEKCYLLGFLDWKIIFSTLMEKYPESSSQRLWVFEIFLNLVEIKQYLTPDDVAFVLDLLASNPKRALQMQRRLQRILVSK